MYSVAVPSLIVASSLLLTSTSASPLLRREDERDNGSCEALNQLCISQVDASVRDPWSIKPCVLAASCYESGNVTQVDDYLATLYAAKSVSVGDAPYSVNLPRVSDAVFQNISTDGRYISQQNYIDAYYSTLDESGGPYPTDDYVVQSYYSNLTQWNGCNSGSLSEASWADFFQYSSLIETVGGFNDCDAVKPTSPLSCVSAQISSTNLILGADRLSVGFNSTYNISAALADLGLPPTDDDHVNGLEVLSGQPTYPGTGVQIEFCNSSYMEYPLAKENTPSAGLFVYWGHVTATPYDPYNPVTPQCLSLRTVNDHDFIVRQNCSYTDNASQVGQFWRANQNEINGYEETNFTITLLGNKNSDNASPFKLAGNGSSAVIVNDDNRDAEDLYATYIHIN